MKKHSLGQLPLCAPQWVNCPIFSSQMTNIPERRTVSSPDSHRYPDMISELADEKQGLDKSGKAALTCQGAGAGVRSSGGTKSHGLYHLVASWLEWWIRSPSVEGFRLGSASLSSFLLLSYLRTFIFESYSVTSVIKLGFFSIFIYWGKLGSYYISSMGEYTGPLLWWVPSGSPLPPWNGLGPETQGCKATIWRGIIPPEVWFHGKWHLCVLSNCIQIRSAPHLSRGRSFNSLSSTGTLGRWLHTRQQL